MKIELFPKTCKKPILILVVTGTLIGVMYFLSTHIFDRSVIKWDPMNKVFFSIGPIKIGLWPISHFIWYFYLGFFYSECWLPLMLLGIAWEGMELTAGYLFEKHRKDVLPYDAIYSGKWWKANLYDPIFNASGFLCGWLFAMTVYGKRKNLFKTPYVTNLSETNKILKKIKQRLDEIGS